MATRSNHAPGEKRGEERRRKKEKKDGRLAPFGIVAHQSTRGIRTLSGLAVLREGLTAMQTTATDDGDERRRYNEWLLRGELDNDAEDDDERCQRTTATNNGGAANHFSSGMRQRRGPRPSSSPHHFPPAWSQTSTRASGAPSGRHQDPGLPAGQPDHFSCATALTTAISDGCIVHPDGAVRWSREEDHDGADLDMDDNLGRTVPGLVSCSSDGGWAQTLRRIRPKPDGRTGAQASRRQVLVEARGATQACARLSLR